MFRGQVGLLPVLLTGIVCPEQSMSNLVGKRAQQWSRKWGRKVYQQLGSFRYTLRMWEGSKSGRTSYLFF